MTKLNPFIAFISALFVLSCGESDRQMEPYSFTEMAMSSNMIIEANNKNGSVSIEYLSPLERRYKWNNSDENRILIPRKVRWRGLLGAYDPATTYVWEIFSPRIVAEDSQLHFNNIDDIKKWLYQGSTVMDWIYTDDGLVVGFLKSSSRNQVNIEVYQIYLNGEKPTKLEGSRPENIKISWKK